MTDSKRSQAASQHTQQIESKEKKSPAPFSLRLFRPEPTEVSEQPLHHHPWLKYENTGLHAGLYLSKFENEALYKCGAAIAEAHYQLLNTHFFYNVSGIILKYLNLDRHSTAPNLFSSSDKLFFGNALFPDIPFLGYGSSRQQLYVYRELKNYFAPHPNQIGIKADCLGINHEQQYIFSLNMVVTKQHPGNEMTCLYLPYEDCNSVGILWATTCAFTHAFNAEQKSKAELTICSYRRINNQLFKTSPFRRDLDSGVDAYIHNLYNFSAKNKNELKLFIENICQKILANKGRSYLRTILLVSSRFDDIVDQSKFSSTIQRTIIKAAIIGLIENATKKINTEEFERYYADEMLDKAVKGEIFLPHLLANLLAAEEDPDQRYYFYLQLQGDTSFLEIKIIEIEDSEREMLPLPPEEYDLTALTKLGNRASRLDRIDKTELASHLPTLIETPRLPIQFEIDSMGYPITYTGETNTQNTIYAAIPTSRITTPTQLIPFKIKAGTQTCEIKLNAQSQKLIDQSDKYWQHKTHLIRKLEAKLQINRDTNPLTTKPSNWRLFCQFSEPDFKRQPDIKVDLHNISINKNKLSETFLILTANAREEKIAQAMRKIWSLLESDKTQFAFGGRLLTCSDCVSEYENGNTSLGPDFELFILKVYILRNLLPGGLRRTASLQSMEVVGRDHVIFENAAILLKPFTASPHLEFDRLLKKLFRTFTHGKIKEAGKRYYPLFTFEPRIWLERDEKHNVRGFQCFDMKTEISFMIKLHQRTPTTKWNLFQSSLDLMFENERAAQDQFVKQTEQIVANKLVAEIKCELEKSGKIDTLDKLARFYSECADRCHFTWYSAAIRKQAETAFLKIKNLDQLAGLIIHLPPNKKSLTEHLLILYRDLIAPVEKSKDHIKDYALLLECCTYHAAITPLRDKIRNILTALKCTSTRYAEIKQIYLDLILAFNSPKTIEERGKQIESILINAYCTIRFNIKKHRGAGSKLGDALQTLLQEGFGYKNLPKTFDRPISTRAHKSTPKECSDLCWEAKIEYSYDIWDECVKTIIKKIIACTIIANDDNWDSKIRDMKKTEAKMLREVLVKRGIYVPEKLGTTLVVEHVSKYAPNASQSQKHKYHP